MGRQTSITTVLDRAPKTERRRIRSKDTSVKERIMAFSLTIYLD